MFETGTPAPATRRERFALQSCTAEKGNISIIAISAGSGNGWEFPADVLRASLPLWEGVECFIDHDWKARSLRDLAGVCFDPRWSDEQAGVQLSLRPLGPAAALLEQAADAMSAPDGPSPHIGFSADLVFAATGRQVTRIEKVLSVDLVVHPARGGTFIKTESQPGLNRGQEQLEPQEKKMENTESIETNAPEKPGEGQEGSVQAQMCACLLDASLAAAHLPLSAENNLRARFSSGVFEPSALQQAISDTRTLISDLTAGSIIQGAGHVSIIANPEDQVNAALHDLLGASRPRELENLHTGAPQRHP